MTTFRPGWFCGGVLALALTAWFASATTASAQSTRLQQTQKSTNKSTPKKDLGNPAAKPPAVIVNPRPPVTNGGTVQNISGLARISYAPPNTWAIYTVSGAGAFNPYNNVPPAFIPGLYANPYLNPYANIYNQPQSIYPNPYLTPNSPVNPLAYNQYPPLPYYNTLYSNYAPNPLINVNPAFMPFNPYNPYSQTQTNPFLNYTPPLFPGFDGLGGSFGGGLLYRGVGY
ncbi:MAG TPA: hypothetical protein VE988_25145 [Gemmataceae bacterium]|nr:hypothetical protein [Gemmataceae bacterium]